MVSPKVKKYICSCEVDLSHSHVHGINWKTQSYGSQCYVICPSAMLLFPQRFSLGVHNGERRIRKKLLKECKCLLFGSQKALSLSSLSAHIRKTFDSQASLTTCTLQWYKLEVPRMHHHWKVVVTCFNYFLNLHSLKFAVIRLLVKAMNKFGYT